MNTNELQKKETEAVNSSASASTDTETSVTSDVMNPPVSKDSKNFQNELKLLILW